LPLDRQKEYCGLDALYMSGSGIARLLLGAWTYEKCILNCTLRNVLTKEAIRVQNLRSSWMSCTGRWYNIQSQWMATKVLPTAYLATSMLAERMGMDVESQEDILLHELASLQHKACDLLQNLCAVFPPQS
jgi:hypothetical protein